METKGASARLLRHLLAQAENEAGLALRQSVRALNAWSDAMKDHWEGKAKVSAVDAAESAFYEARAVRLQADAKVAELRRRVVEVSGTLPRPEVA